MLLTTQWRSTTVIVEVDPALRRVTRITPPNASWSLLAVTAGTFLCPVPLTLRFL